MDRIKDDFDELYNCIQMSKSIKLNILKGEFNYVLIYRLPWWFSSKESACNAGGTGNMSSSPRSGRSPGGGNGKPFQYSCLGNPMDRGAWHAMVLGV